MIMMMMVIDTWVNDEIKMGMAILLQPHTTERKLLRMHLAEEYTTSNCSLYRGKLIFSGKRRRRLYTTTPDRSFIIRVVTPIMIIRKWTIGHLKNEETTLEGFWKNSMQCKYSSSSCPHNITSYIERKLIHLPGQCRQVHIPSKYCFAKICTLKERHTRREGERETIITRSLFCRPTYLLSAFTDRTSQPAHAMQLPIVYKITCVFIYRLLGPSRSPYCLFVFVFLFDKHWVRLYGDDDGRRDDELLSP